RLSHGAKVRSIVCVKVASLASPNVSSLPHATAPRDEIPSPPSRPVRQPVSSSAAAALTGEIYDMLDSSHDHNAHMIALGAMIGGVDASTAVKRYYDIYQSLDMDLDDRAGVIAAGALAGGRDSAYSVQLFTDMHRALSWGLREYSDVVTMGALMAGADVPT